ncbi:MAG: sulfurtransferase TusA family protein [Candidatus Xenobia bacterium]
MRGARAPLWESHCPPGWIVARAGRAAPGNLRAVGARAARLASEQQDTGTLTKVRSASAEPVFPEGKESAASAGNMAEPMQDDAVWDAGAMGCGELVLELRMRLRDMAPGQVMKLIALDPGAPVDLPAWCGMTGHTLVSAEHPVYRIRRKD